LRKVIPVDEQFTLAIPEDKEISFRNAVDMNIHNDLFLGPPLDGVKNGRDKKKYGKEEKRNFSFL